jgi:hypothetical protein
MNLNGNKENVNVTLQLQINGCLLTVDNAHKVLHVQYNDSTTLHQVKKDIDRLVEQLGYKPTKIVHTKVKQFKFK